MCSYYPIPKCPFSFKIQEKVVLEYLQPHKTTIYRAQHTQIIFSSYSDVEILHCICNLSLNISLSLSFSYTRALPYSAHYRMVVNASGSPVLWRVNERGFICSSILNSTTTRFLQASDGLVVSEDLLALGQNYFLSKIHSASHRLKKAFFIH